MLECEEHSNSINGGSSCNESDYNDVPSDEVFCNEEKTSCDKGFDSSICSTNVTTIVSIVDQPDYD